MRSLGIRAVVVLPLLAVASLSACGGSSGSMANSLPPANGTQSISSTQSVLAKPVDSDLSASAPVTADTTSVLKKLRGRRIIGSTVDPMNGDQNPYGLDVAKATSGAIAAGDLVVCNFNDAANIQGNGTTMEVLHPKQGSVPVRLAQDASLKGCDALALSPSDNPWVAAFGSNLNPIFSSSGTLLTTLSQYPWYRPWGQAFATRGATGGAAFYESNAYDGSIIRIDVGPSGFRFDRIATGFAINYGQPGSILGPSGLQYDAKLDRLYVVDGMSNTVVALNHVTTIPDGGIHVNADGTSFSGPFAKRGKVIWSGAPLNGPISSALLSNGNIVVGNTLDPNGKDLMVELTRSGGQVLAVRNVDTGAAGAIFGMVATGSTDYTTSLYFNDDNDNALEVLSP